MIDIDILRECENNFPVDFANTIDTSYGRLFHNADNPTSHDSNHAIILDLTADIDAAVADIAAFYGKLNIPPRTYQAYLPGEEEVLRPYFARHGFVFREFGENDYFEHVKRSAITVSSDIIFKRVTELDPALEGMIWSEDENDREIKVLRNHVKADSFHLLAGYLGTTPVTMGSVKLMDGLSRVDDVLTPRQHRGHGYGRALTDHLVKYHSALSRNALYLYASNPTAIRIYREAGFVDMPLALKSWSAWKETPGGG
jgi:ribosomal protein S18 acetylase RimI-like enzyme